MPLRRSPRLVWKPSATPILPRLPAELLLQILNHVGPAFFAEDTRRLTVSKQWYAVAWQVLRQDLALTAATLQKHALDAAFLTQCRQYVVSVDVELFGSRVDGTNLASSWTKLAAALQKGSKVRSLKVVEGNGRNDYDHIGPTWHSMATSLVDLLAASPLTCLDLDTTNPAHMGPSVHLCSAINALLPSLCRLRVRMRTVCEQLLKPPEGNQPLKLEELVVNMFLQRQGQRRHTMPWFRSTLCATPPGESNKVNRQLQSWESTIHSQARALAVRAPSPRMVAIIGLNFTPFGGLRVYDAVADEVTKLWDYKPHWDMVETEMDSSLSGEDSKQRTLNKRRIFAQISVYGHPRPSRARS